MKKSKLCKLLHGSPMKIKVGDYLDPAYCGMWEQDNSKALHPKSGKKENALFFTNDLRPALIYARREIYSPQIIDFEKELETQYFIFNKPDAEIYVYTAEIPSEKILETNQAGKICFEPVKILDRQDFDVERILQYYSQADRQNTVARVLKQEKLKCSHLELKFGAIGVNVGKSCADEYDKIKLLKDLQEYTDPIQGISDRLYEKS